VSVSLLQGRELAAEGSLHASVLQLSGVYEEVPAAAVAGSQSPADFVVAWAGVPDMGPSFISSAPNIYSRLGRKTSQLQATTIQYEYDPIYRVTGAAYTGAITATFTYLYDVVGNMTAYTETIGTETTNVVRAFDAANRLETSDDGRGETSYTYDENGNLKAVAGTASGQSYRYDQRNLLTGITTGPLEFTLVDYVYDGAGNRVQQISYLDNQPVSVVTYTNDIIGLAQVLVADVGTTQTANLFGLSLIHQDDGDEIRSLLSDGLGSVRQEIVAAGVASAATGASKRLRTCVTTLCRFGMPFTTKTSVGLR
jgi:YD repeat-containing protein